MNPVPVTLLALLLAAAADPPDRADPKAWSDVLGPATTTAPAASAPKACAGIEGALPLAGAVVMPTGDQVQATGVARDAVGGAAGDGD